MEFNYKQFLTENKLTPQSRVKSLFERDQSDEHESNSGKINEKQSVIVNGKPVDVNSIEIDGVEMYDYPDFSDAYVINATFEDGIDLTDTELEELQEEYPDLVHELAHESIQEGKEEDDDEFQDEPTSKDIKPSKSTDNLAEKQYRLASLLKRKDELVSKFKYNEINFDQYKQMIGNIPQQIITLKADIEKLEAGELNEADNYENLTLKMSKFAEALDKYEEHQLKTMLVELAWKETTIEKLIDSVLEFENINN